MSKAVQERRDTLWILLGEVPDGLTRTELAKLSGIKPATVKTDLQALSAQGRVEVRQGGSGSGVQGSYRRAWVALKSKPGETPPCSTPCS